jgi:hypothetical protein
MCSSERCWRLHSWLFHFHLRPGLTTFGTTLTRIAGMNRPTVATLSLILSSKATFTGVDLCYEYTEAYDGCDTCCSGRTKDV